MFTTPMFYIGWIIIALLPLMVAIIAPQKIRNKIIASAGVLAVTLALMCGMYAEHENDYSRWNNGIHIDCGGEYQFSGATKWRTSESFYYTCDKCGHTEEFSSIMK